MHTHPRLETIAQDNLQRQGFEVYFPLYKIMRPQKGKQASESSTSAHEAMFPRYLFIRPTYPEQSMAVVRSTLGVSRLVLFGMQPARLAHATVQAIRQIESQRETASLKELSPYRSGDRVRLNDTALSGVEAIVHRVAHDRVHLLLEILGKPHILQVKLSQIRPS
ncbi:transcription termination/antitermination protein NusG [Castellaniella sp.]|uniref:transcription termination/antitermination protein NusG n=1 Tax=Castellaniella sp. TaxID=1955812 RepID=UPI002AFF65D5|nr:transcription termination/antitermination NusG family protein [Castellaniella sp.]